MDNPNHTPVVCYVITNNTTDFGNKYVVRIHRIASGTITPDPLPFAVVDSLEAARAEIPKGLIQFPRMDGDHYVIVESWM
jgi:hypothetical protein